MTPRLPGEALFSVPCRQNKESPAIMLIPTPSSPSGQGRFFYRAAQPFPLLSEKFITFVN